MATRYRLNESQCQNLEVSKRREWLLTNGIGGFAMGSASGINTRRYHGLLVAATHPPTGRMVLLAGIDDYATSGSNRLPLSTNEYPGATYPDGYAYLRSFQFESDAQWLYRSGSMGIRKSVAMTPGENTVTLTYLNVGTGAVELSIKPLVCHRDFHGNFSESAIYPQGLEFAEDQTCIEGEGIKLHLLHKGARRMPIHGWYYRFEHFRETERGLDPRDDLYCPCELKYSLAAGESVSFVASTDPSAVPLVLPESQDAESPTDLDTLRGAVAPFVISTEQRVSIIAGYPWFTDWGRDTMISLPGVCLSTGRFDVARRILRDYASQVFQGLIPNRFVEKGERADYNTVDATLWFGNAIYKTLVAEWNEEFAKEMMTVLDDIFEWHRNGTLFGIKVDGSNGLLTQGEPGLQLTWMDAKIGDWVVTPRHGKPVEINGLWINLLRICEWLALKLGHESKKYAEIATLAESNFESKFWHPIRGHYLDTCDPDDATLRPNQLIAMALPFTPVSPENARKALKVIQQELVTPVGIRTLGPKEPGYRGKFRGPMTELDASYHQGTVWPWLIGPYISALVKFTGDTAGARRVLRETREMLQEYGLNGIAECYDGDEPHEPGGCPWQAWSAAEILRCWSEDLGTEQS